jgi:hypothetical protein
MGTYGTHETYGMRAQGAKAVPISPMNLIGPIRATPLALFPTQTDCHHQSRFPLVSQLETNDWRKRTPAGGRRQFGDLLTCFLNRVIYD